MDRARPALAGADRSEFLMVGGAGSANAMRDIKGGTGVLKATVIYPSTQGADGIELARLLVQKKGLNDLPAVEVPRVVPLYAPVVTKGRRRLLPRHRGRVLTPASSTPNLTRRMAP